ncbi:hypothetical protein [Brucella intermedia]
MGKPHPIELRERVVAFVNEGNSHREAARHFRVSPRFVNNMMILHRSSGCLAAARQGHPPGSVKLLAHGDWVREQMSARGETTWTNCALRSRSAVLKSTAPRSGDFDLPLRISSRMD